MNSIIINLFLDDELKPLIKRAVELFGEDVVEASAEGAWANGAVARARDWTAWKAELRRLLTPR